MDLNYVFRRVKRLLVRFLKKLLIIFGLEIVRSQDYRNIVKINDIYNESINRQNRLSHDQLFLGTLSNNKAIQDKNI